MSAEAHPNRDELSRFVAGELAAPANRRVVRHLLSGCRDCREAAAELWRPTRVGELAGVVDRAIRRAVGRGASVSRERREGARLLDELSRQPPSRRLLLVLNSRRYCNWFLCEALIEEAFEGGLSDPVAAVARAEEAAALAERLLRVRGEEPVNRDLLARAWAVVGNCRRIASDMSGAEEALARAL